MNMNTLNILYRLYLHHIAYLPLVFYPSRLFKYLSHMLIILQNFSMTLHYYTGRGWLHIWIQARLYLGVVVTHVASWQFP